MHFMKKLGILSIIVVTAVLFAGIGMYLATPKKTVESAVNAPQSIPLDANKILELVNIERAKVGVAPLVSDPRLVATAQSRADDMVKRDYFGHFDPMTGENQVKIRATNPQCITASENISQNWSTDEGAVGGWMGSKPHHDAMLDPKYTLTGVATNGNIGVQHFCQTN